MRCLLPQSITLTRWPRRNAVAVVLVQFKIVQHLVNVYQIHCVAGVASDVRNRNRPLSGRSRTPVCQSYPQLARYRFHRKRFSRRFFTLRTGSKENMLQLIPTKQRGHCYHQHHVAAVAMAWIVFSIVKQSQGTKLKGVVTICTHFKRDNYLNLPQKTIITPNYV